MRNNNGSPRPKLTKREEASLIKLSFFRILVTTALWGLLFLMSEIAGEFDNSFYEIILIVYVLFDIISTIVEIQTK